MIKRKKLPQIPDYEGMGPTPGKLTAHKTNPLMSLSETSMTLAELKILDIYLSRINSHDPEHRYVRIRKGEIEKLLGVDRIRREELFKRLKNLFQVVTIRDETKRDGYTLISLFEKVEALHDDDGLWQVDLVCTPSAMEYIFSPENIGYLRYRLANVVNLTSRYSYVLYLYLENNRYRESWNIGLQELKDMLRCNAETYQQFKRFNDLVLKPCKKELDTKTTLRFEYKPVRNGRKVAEIQFTVLQSYIPQLSEKDEKEIKDTATPVEAQMEQKRTEFEDEVLEFLAAACNYSFTEREMEVISAILASHRVGAGDEDVQDSRFRYLSRMYGYLRHQEERSAADGKQIKDRFRYFKRMLDNDAAY